MWQPAKYTVGNEAIERRKDLLTTIIIIVVILIARTQ